MVDGPSAAVHPVTCTLDDDLRRSRVTLVLGRTPPGLRRLSLYAIRYIAQVNAYGLLLTDGYPNPSPLEAGEEDLLPKAAAVLAA